MLVGVLQNGDGLGIINHVMLQRRKERNSRSVVHWEV